jgi:hypothetical protein
MRYTYAEWSYIQARADDLKARFKACFPNPIDHTKVESTSFVVCRELDAQTGEVVNPLIQFAIGAINEPARRALLGQPVGTVIAFPGKWSVEIVRAVEIYRGVA